MASTPTQADRLRLSRRVESLRPSSTLAVAAKAKALELAGKQILTFSTGEPDFDTPEPIKQAVWKAIQAGRTGYGAVPGSLDARKLIADRFARENGIDTSPDHIVISAGGKHCLYNIIQALVDPPKPGEQPAEAILPVPAWVSYAPQAELAGAKVIEVDTTPDSGFRMSPEQLEAAITPNTRLLFLNSPSNPCGTMYTPDDLRTLAAVVERAANTIAPNLVVISDEIYDKLIYPELAPNETVEHFSIGSIPAIAERVITVNGLSKTYAMTGWRLGYFTGSGQYGLDVAKGAAKLQAQSTTAVPDFFMPAFDAAFSACDAIVEERRRAFASRGKLMHDMLSNIPGLVTPAPVGAFYCFPDVSAHFGKRSPNGALIVSAMSFAAALLEEHLVAVVPGEDFGGAGANCCRLTFACNEAQITQGVERVGAFVASLK
ncbi:MAG: pyridoxal phosphate-dependent aminotransferase [Phycisphaerales bacterium]|nr:pyridoxal phosphate-dependent aminotransferase [Phycisphaerales bacterium]